MSVDQAVASEQWYRYVYLRDNGHLDFVEKANKCDAYYLGQQWTRADKAILEAQRRPALTINKILPTIDTVVGEQINTRPPRPPDAPAGCAAPVRVPGHPRRRPPPGRSCRCRPAPPRSSGRA